MKTILIKGKPYVQVVERVKEFNRIHSEGSIMTSIVSNDGKRVIVRAEVKIGLKTFVGHSQSKWDEGNMGAVALEVAETSAVGRALGFAGIGIIDGIASADEIKKNDKSVKLEDILPF